MALKGFICPRTKEPIAFDSCFKGCPKRCHPLPTLLALADGHREVKPGVYHVTEILNPPKVVYLQRHRDFYREPESLIYVTFGRAFHTIMAEQKDRVQALAGADYQFEDDNHFEVEIKTKHGNAILSGTPDLIIFSQKEIVDYKTGKYFYEVQKLLEGNSDSKYPMQLNIYRAYGYPEAEKLFLEMNIKDYNQRVRETGVKPIERIQIPTMPIPKVKTFVEERIAELLYNEEHPDKIRDCNEDELWGGIRCEQYCDGHEFCLQFLERKAKDERKKGSASRRKERG